MYFISCEKDMASSMPGTELKIYCIKLFVPWSSPKLNISYSDVIFSTSTFGSISYVPFFHTIACKFGIPWMGVGSLVTFWSKQSLKLWAGSVEMMRVFLPPSANRVAKLLLVVVFPTPPLPPTKIHLKDFCSRMFLKLPSQFIT